MPRSLRWPDPRVKPPYGAVELDQSHPLAVGLVAFWLFNDEGGIAHDLCGNYDGTITLPSAVTWSASNVGRGITSAASSSTTIGLTLNRNVTFGGVDGSWESRVRPTSAGDSYGTLFVLASATQGIWYRHATGKIDFYQGVDQENTTAITLGTTHSYLLSLELNGVLTSGTWYLDGAADGSLAVHASFATYNSLFNDIVSETFAGDCEFMRVWSRRMSAGDPLWLAAEPYAMLRPIVRRRYSVPAAVDNIFRSRIAGGRVIAA